jgi:hypothetical protein
VFVVLVLNFENLELASCKSVQFSFDLLLQSQIDMFASTVQVAALIGVWASGPAIVCLRPTTQRYKSAVANFTFLAYSFVSVRRVLCTVKKYFRSVRLFDLSVFGAFQYTSLVFRRLMHAPSRQMGIPRCHKPCTCDVSYVALALSLFLCVVPRIFLLFCLVECLQIIFFFFFLL